ncbi:MAG: S8 family serine peptidase [Defluviitaleaceae bacterium]|nr:S8 family serine peptidase [Defluviitaleaceae bacterium]
MVNYDVIIIDSGIDKGHKVFNSAVIETYCFKSDTWQIENMPDVKNGHGTAVASIIANGIPGIKICSFQLFNEQLECSDEMLISCLEFINQNIDCKIINFSLGIKIYDRKLESICSMLASGGIMLIAAFSNEGGVSYPAGFDCVVGVDASHRCRKNDDFVYIRKGVVNVKAKGANQRVAWLQDKYMITQGASYACAYVTNFALKLCINGNYLAYNEFSVYSLYKEIEAKSIHIYENAEGHVPSSDFLKYAEVVAIFPFNKETASFLHFNDMLTFKVIDFYDYKKFGKVGLDVSGIYSNCAYKIKNIETCEWGSFDTMIIGHLDEMSSHINFDIKSWLVEKCVQEQKNVYLLDVENFQIDKSIFQKNELMLGFPTIEKSYDFSVDMGKLYSISTPVIGVFGTSKQQGKFSVQLLLRRELQNQNYKVAQLGSESQSALFGFDYMLPFGYEGFDDLNYRQTVPMLNRFMFELDKNETDIIIVGSQAGTIPHSYENIMYLTDGQLDFIFGTLPDCVVLCINYHDDIDYIMRTIKAIEALADCSVLSLCLFPLGYMSEWDLMMDKKTYIDKDVLSNKCEELTKLFNIPVLPIDSECFAKSLVKYIVDYFGGDENNA